MTDPRCERSWQAEALEDRRLEPKDKASFERHLESCAHCARELDQLRTLGGLMRGVSRRERSELAHRRARARLLNAASRGELARSSPAWRRAIWALGAAIPALALAALWLRSPAQPGFEVRDVAHADWRVEERGSTVRVALRAGTAAFQVQHVAANARFLLELPDGEIEVRGTRFVVDVQEAHTRSVTVSEGVVALRLAGGERILRAGSSWLAETPEVAPTPTAAEVVEPSTSAPVQPVASADSSRASAQQPTRRPASTSKEPSVAISSVTAPTLSQTPLPGSEAPAASASAAPAVVASENAGARFALAVAAFSVGDYGHADALLAAFMRDFPHDTRAEDAAFLRADARARRGDRAGAAAAAREYLQRYPHGLREPEAERLIRAQQ